ncbi:MAG: hypothetical protein QME73_12110 [Bacillota bacterium]|nr:hypothetical protein [Bacillota bacterium]
MNSTDVSAIPVTNSGILNPDNGDMALIAVPVNSAREVRVITFEIRYSLILSGVIIIYSRVDSPLSSNTRPPIK